MWGGGGWERAQNLAVKWPSVPRSLIPAAMGPLFQFIVSYLFKLFLSSVSVSSGP